jgi:MFS family permease
MLVERVRVVLRDHLVVAAGFFVCGVLFGTIYSFPPLAPRIADTLHVGRAGVVGSFAVLLLATAAASPPAGRVLDRFGPRVALVAGMTLLLGAWVLVAQASAEWQLYAVSVLLLAPAFALLQVAALVALSRSERRGRALGVGGAGIGSGLTIVPLFAIWLGERSWRASFLALAGLAALALPAAWVLGRQRASRPSRLGRGAALRTLVGSRLFAALFAGGIAIGVIDEAVYQHLVPHLTNSGFGATSAGTVLAATSGVYMLGQIGGGVSTDRWGGLRVGLLAAAAAAAGLLLFTLGNSVSEAGLLVGAALYGFGLGGTIVVRSALLAELFDGPAFGTVAGLYQWAYALGGAGIGWFGALLFGRSGSYVATFVIAIAATAAWVLCLLYVAGAASHARARQEPRRSAARGRLVGSLESEP